MGALWHFLLSYYYVLGVLMILTGIFLMIFGGRLFKVTMFLAATVFVTAFILILMYVSLLPNRLPTWFVWLSFIVALGMGSGMGFGA
jgi:hypothetical protein